MSLDLHASETNNNINRYIFFYNINKCIMNRLYVAFSRMQAANKNSNRVIAMLKTSALVSNFPSPSFLSYQCLYKYTERKKNRNLYVFPSLTKN